MRRLARRLFTLASAASLLLCVAVGALWVRNYWVYDALYWKPVQGEWNLSLSSTNGVFAAIHTGKGGPNTTAGSGSTEFLYQTQAPEDLLPLLPATLAPARGAYHGSWAGIVYVRIDLTNGQGRFRRQHRVQEAIVPWGWIALVASLAPATWALARVRRWARGLGAGYCPHCGYDLRASPERCPECGKAAAANS